MSYGFTLTVPAGYDIAEPNYLKVKESFEDYVLSLNFGDSLEAVRDHIEMAAEAVDYLARVCGVSGETLSVSVNGHANPNHAQTPGWADEFISVSVRVDRAAEAPLAAAA